MGYFPSVMQVLGLSGGIIFSLVGMHFRAHDVKTADYEKLVTKTDMVSGRVLTPSGFRAAWGIRGFRYHLVGVMLFIIGGVAGLIPK